MMKAEQLVFRLSQGREDNGVQSPLCFGRLRRPLAGEEVEMNFLEERIVREGAAKEGNVLKVDSFLNHQLDIDLLDEIGREFKRIFWKEEDKQNTYHRGFRPCLSHVWPAISL